MKAGLEPEPDSTINEEPPRPDIRCLIAESLYQFELGEITDEGLAHPKFITSVVTLINVLSFQAGTAVCRNRQTLIGLIRLDQAKYFVITFAEFQTGDREGILCLSDQFGLLLSQRQSFFFPSSCPLKP